jgi:M6 family metalloprotease-like protein
MAFHWRSTRLALVIGLAVVLGIASGPSAYAVKAYPKPVTYYQPDGTPFEARMIGDERIVFVEDAEGYTLVKDPETGWYSYADPSSHGGEQLRGSKLRAGKEKAPRVWRKHVRPAVDPNRLPGPPLVQQDDGSVARLFRSSMGRSPKTGTMSIGSDAVKLTPTTVPVLVILVEFSDWKHTQGANTPVAGEPNYELLPGQPNNAPTWEKVFNDPTVPGGLNHFYKEATYGRFQWDVKVAPRGVGQAGTGTLVNNGWYTNPNTMAYWGTDVSGLRGACNRDGGSAIKNLITWAVQQADADVNFAAYDTDANGSISDAELMIFVVHAREGQENYGYGCGTNPDDPKNDHIWSHKWNMATNVAVDGKTIPAGHIYAIEPEFSPIFNYATNPWTLTEKYFGVGVYAHEALHTLGATDIYDIDGDAEPAGDWDLMDSGSYNGVKSGTHPAHMGTALKQDIKMNADTDANSYGFLLESDIRDVHPTDGVYKVNPLGGSTADGVLHRVKSPNDVDEWFLIENRAAVGYYEPYLPEHGLVIWHRDRAAAVGNNSYPYEANVLRKGWANTSAGLNSIVLGAAFSADDGEASFTSTTDPHNKLNAGGASGIKDVRCISAETSVMSYVYGATSATHVTYAGTAVSGGDGDDWLDYGESATLTVRVGNSSCAGATASNISVVVTSLDATVGSSLPSSIASLAAGSIGDFNFNVNLNCSTCSSVSFDYIVYEGGVAVATGTVKRDANRSYLWFDDVDAQRKTGWTSNTSFKPSACTTAVRHGDWSVVPHPTAPRGNSYRAPVDTTGLTFANPDEVWISPNIVIPSGTNLRDFRFSYAAEIPCPNYTRGRLWVSTDDGVTWQRHEDFYRDGGNLSWEEVTTSLAPYAGASQIRFLFGLYTWTCQSGCTATRGLYVDNIGVIISQQASGPADTTAPTTSITSPSEGATVSGTTTVSATASDDTGVTRVEFYVNGSLAASDTSAPYSFSWDTTAVANGTYALTSKAFDGAGNNSTSAAVSVNVSNAVFVDTTAPSTSITAPAAGSTVSGTTSVTASASDDTGVTKVEFYVNGTLAATDTSSPYSFSWNTTTVANGSHTLSSKAYDGAGNVGSSASVSVNVSNSTADTTGPVISGVSSRKTSGSSFEVLWTTNELSDSAVSFDNQASWHTNASMVTSHLMGFRGSKGVKYTYYVRSKDAAGNTSIAGPFIHQN